MIVQKMSKSPSIPILRMEGEGEGGGEYNTETYTPKQRGSKMVGPNVATPRVPRSHPMANGHG